VPDGTTSTPTEPQPPGSEEGDLSDLLSELRVLLPGSQTLTAFLIILPFQGGFAEIRDNEQIIYMITFLCSLASLVCFTAPAAHHRLQRPLWDREAFKTRATRLIIIGLAPLSIALILATQLVTSTIVSEAWMSWLVAGLVGLGILFLWWLYPKMNRDEMSTPPDRA